MAASDSPSHPRFLIAADRSPGAEPHLAFGVRLANAFDAECTLTHAVPSRQAAVTGAVDPTDSPLGADAEEARGSLTSLAGTLSADRPVQVEIMTGKTPVEAVLESADRLAADLIVLPSHGRMGLSRAVLGSTAEEIMRRATRPALLLTDHMLANEADTAADRGPVVLATDLSEAATAAHRPAARFAKRLGLPLQILSIVPTFEPLPYGQGAPGDPVQPNAAALIAHREAELRQLASEFGGGVEYDVTVLMDDDVATAIIDSAAASNAAMIVLATHGRRGIERMVQGSVAEQIVRRSTVPVICMPAKTG